MDQVPGTTFNQKKNPLRAHAPESWQEVLAAFEDDLFRRGRSDHTVSTYAYAMRSFGAFYRDELKKDLDEVLKIS